MKLAGLQIAAIAVGYGTTPSENLPDLPNEIRAVANSPISPVLNSLNVGTVTGKGRSLVDMLETRKAGLLCV